MTPTLLLLACAGPVASAPGDGVPLPPDDPAAPVAPHEITRSAEAPAPEEAAPSAEASAPQSVSHPPEEAAPVPGDPTRFPVELRLPYMPWEDAYARVRADPDMGPILDREMIPALEAPGDPAERLRAMAAAASRARQRFVASGRQADLSFNGLDPVETDLRIAFFSALAQRIATADAPRDERIAALERLLELVSADPPLGVPAFDERLAWTHTARVTAQVNIQVHLEALRGGG